MNLSNSVYLKCHFNITNVKIRNELCYSFQRALEEEHSLQNKSVSHRREGMGWMTPHGVKRPKTFYLKCEKETRLYKYVIFE